MEHLETFYETEDEILTVYLERELDHHNAGAIRQNVDRYVIQGGIKYVIFDFSETGFMDSSGIGVIMGRQKMLEGIGGKVFVRHMSQDMQRIFMISGMHKLVEELG